MQYDAPEVVKSIKLGRPRKFKSPDELYAVACAYFNWAENNPIYEETAFAYKGDVTVHKIARPRVFSIIGLCVFAGIAHKNFLYTYAADPAYETAIGMINSIIYQNKFEGAVSGVFKENIIARELGLKDKMDHVSEDGSMSPKETTTIVVTGEDVKSVLAML